MSDKRKTKPELIEELKRLREHVAALESAEKRHAAAAEKLRKSEKRLRLLFEFAPDAYYLHDAQGTFVDGNRAVEELTGYERDELKGKSFLELDLLPPEEAEEAAELLAVIGTGRPVGPRELTILNREGDRVPIEVLAYPVRIQGRDLVLGIARDVTQRRRAERELREADSRYRALVESATDCIYMIDRNGRVLSANPAAAAFLGRSLEEVAGKTVLELFPEDAARGYMQSLNAVFASGQPGYYETKLTSQGKELWTSVSLSPVRNAEGETVAVMGANRDITVCKEAEAALTRHQHELEKLVRERTSQVERSERKYRALAEQSLQALLIVQGSPPRVVFANPAVEGLTGYTAGEMQALPPDELLSLVLEDDREGVLERIRDRLEGKQLPPHHEITVVRKDGEVRFVMASGCLVDYDGKPAIEATLVDVTERKRMEEALRTSELRYRTTIDSMADAIHVVDTDLCVTLCNVAMTRWIAALGLATDIVGRNVFEVFPFLPDSVREEYADVMEHGRTLVTEEATAIGDEEILTETRKIPVFDQGGDVTGVVTVLRDVTESRRAAADLLESEEKYRAAIEQSLENIFILDLESRRVSEANPAMQRLLGYSADEMRKLTIYDFVDHPRDDIDEKIEQATREGRLFLGERRYRRRDGSRVDVGVSLSAIAYGGKKALCIVSRDVTERKRAEEALRESEEGYRGLVEQSVQGILLIQDFRAVFANEALARISGYAVDELLALPPEAVTAIVHPDDQELVWGRFQDRVAGKAVPSEYEFRGIRKDGTDVWLHMLATRVEHGGRPAVQAAIVDISERKLAEKTAEAERTRAQKYLDVAGVMFVVIDARQTVTLVNRRACEVLGYEEKEILGKNWFHTFVPAGVRREVRALHARLLSGTVEPAEYFENPVVTATGEERLIGWHNAILRDDTGKVTGTLSSGTDITERKRVEVGLRESEEKYRTLVEQSLEGLVIAQGPPPRLVFASPAMTDILGHDAEELTSMSPDQLEELVHPEGRAAFFDRFRDRLQGKPVPSRYTLCAKHKDGSVRWLAVSSSLIEYQGRPSVQATFADVTERAEAEEALRHRAEFEQLITTISASFVSRTSDRVDEEITRTLQALGEFTGVDRSYVFLFSDNARKMSNTHEWCSQDTEAQMQRLQELRVEGFAWSTELMKKGEVFHVPRVAALPPDAQSEKAEFELEGIKSLLCVPMMLAGEPVGFLGFDSVQEEKTWVENDISLLGIVGQVVATALERKRAEEALRESEEKYRSLTENLSVGVYRNTAGHKGRFIEANPAIVQMFGYDSREEFLALNVSDLYQQPEERRLVSEKLLKSGAIGDQELRLRRKDGTPFIGSVSAVAVEAEDGTVKYYDGIVEDITDRKQAEEALQNSLVRLGKAMEGIVQAMTITAELRDPYTAGHQRRVTQLACAIAAEIGLPAERTEALRMAGLIHDIGKMHVPAEILSRPGRLSNLEFGLIRAHPQVGHDILTSIEFPWPIAEIIVQHHERMDGSGYPGGLAGGDTLLEARILGVADVVEAMSSHRPYRPAFGVADALEEITRHQGGLYDPEIVAACLRVFEKGDFRFDHGDP